MISRYSTPEMEKLWSEENKFASFLKVELASLKALSQIGIIPESDYLKIKNNATFDVDEIKRLEAETKHDVIAFTRNISTSLQQEKKWFHYGLTSTDVVDSSNSLIIKQANDIIARKLLLFSEAIKEKAYLYKQTPCIGRTHGIHAEVTSFGLKWVMYYDELQRLWGHFNQARQEIEVIKMSGAVGTFSGIPPQVEELASKELGLNYALISTQVISRDRHAFYIFSLAQIASLLEKMATEIRHLSRTEVKEVAEYFASGQKGSSAMPHKRNPIACENICGCARIMKSYVQVAFENNNLWHERDISHSSAERIILADATTLLDYMLSRFTAVISTLIVYEDRMIKNIELTNNVIFSSFVLKALIDKGLSREVAYDLIQPLTFKAIELEVDFKALILDSKIKTILNNNEINECFNLNNNLRNIDEIYERVGL